MNESTANDSTMALIPSRPLDVEEQSEKLQRMGLDFLSSIHWVVILIVALLFAGLVVLMKRQKQAEQDAKMKEADKIVEMGRQELDSVYFLPDGSLNQQLFYVPERYSTTQEFANDETNEKINNIQSQKLLPQIRRLVKSGKLFSFFNSAASAKDMVEETIMKRRGPVVLDENQKLAHSLRSRFGGDRLRNPLIDFQIKDEIDARKQSNDQTTTVCERPNVELLNENQMRKLEDAFN